jgi:cytosine/adenosine deaminase-related metal-dependent hydrolase
VRRLSDSGILDERTLAAHCIHLSAADRRILARRGVNVIHNPQSNCNNAVGTADLLEGVLVGLGSDGYSPRVWDEWKTSLHLQKLRAHDPRAAYLGAMLNNRTIVKKVWGLEVGRIETGAKADLLVADYFPPTPMRADNLFGHLLFGISNAPVDSLIVNGRYVLRDKQCVNLDERRIAQKAAASARALWERL